MVGFLECKVSIVVKSFTAHYPKQHMFVKKKEEENPKGESEPAPERSRTH